jgi:hypothetical protein
MRILFNDIIQYSDAPEEIKNPSLTYFMKNDESLLELLDGGLSDAIYDLLDAENAGSVSDGIVDGGLSDALFDDDIDGGVSFYINDEFDGGHADAVFDEVFDGKNAFSTQEFEITLTTPSTINCIGIGNTDSKAVGFYLIDIFDNTYYENCLFTRNGLYTLKKEYENIKQINLVFSGTYIGRFGTGYAINLKTAVPKEPTLVSTNKPRVTLSGQTILGLGGYNYWRISLDTRYKIDKEKLQNIIDGYKILSTGYPMFISFDDEKKLPIDKMYGVDTSQQTFGFESSINKPLFSRRWVLEERF